MRKAIAILLTMILVASFVFAAQGSGSQGQSASAQGGQSDNAQSGRPEISAEQRSQNRQQNQERLQQGLENALSRARNENAKQRIQQNINTFQNRYQERMQTMTGVRVSSTNSETGAVRVKGREQVRYLGFIPGRATKTFDIDENGNVEERHPWYRFMYTEYSD